MQIKEYDYHHQGLQYQKRDLTKWTTIPAKAQRASYEVWHLITQA